MLRNSIGGLIFAVPLVVALGWGCEQKAPIVGINGVGNPQVCRGFALRDSVFTVRVKSSGGLVDLGGGNSLTFPPQAIPDSATYKVTYAPQNNNQRVAGIEVDSVSGPIVFKKAVTLRLSYAACADLGSKDIFIVEIKNKTATAIGGANLPSDQAIEALISHFTEYAIAL